MLGILLDQIAASGKYKELVVRYSFYTFNGIILGVFLNDIVRILFGDFELKSPYQYAIAGLVGSSGYVLQPLAFFGDKNNNLFLGGGMMLGHWWSQLSESGKKIEILGERNDSTS